MKSFTVFLHLALPLVDASVVDMFALVCLIVSMKMIQRWAQGLDETKTNENKVVTDKQEADREDTQQKYAITQPQ